MSAQSEALVAAVPYGKLSGDTAGAIWKKIQQIGLEASKSTRTKACRTQCDWVTTKWSEVTRQKVRDRR